MYVTLDLPSLSICQLAKSIGAAVTYEKEAEFETKRAGSEQLQSSSTHRMPNRHDHHVTLAFQPITTNHQHAV